MPDEVTEEGDALCYMWMSHRVFPKLLPPFVSVEHLILGVFRQLIGTRHLEFTRIIGQQRVK
jgi:hypothetical protein